MMKNVLEALNAAVDVVALTLVLAVLFAPAATSQQIAYDGIATITAIQGEQETTVAQMKHAHSPFASKEKCETEGAADMPNLAAAISQKYGVVEGQDFKITYVCEVAGRGV